MSDATKLGLCSVWPGEVIVSTTCTADTLDANTEKTACVFNMPYAVTIAHCGFWYGTRTGTPPTYRISIQGVNSSGNPDGTIKGGGSPASNTFTPPADSTWNTQWKWIQLNNSYSASRGEVLSIVIDYSSGTIDASNFSTMGGVASGLGDDRLSFPNKQFYSGSWAKAAGTPLFAFKDGASPTNVWGGLAESVSAQTYSRAAMKFNIPSTFCSTFKIRGAKLRIGTTAGNTFTFGLWNSGGVIQDVTVDTDQIKGGNTGGAELFFDESSLTTLNAGTDYYIGVEQSGGVASLYTQVYDSDIGQQVRMPWGTNAVFSSYNGSVWSDDVTKVPIVILLFDDITAPTGGSGLMVHPGMVGGMRA